MNYLKISLPVLAILMLSTFAWGKDPILTHKVANVPTQVSHEIWDVLLQAHVSAAGKVDYNGFREHEARLDTYLDLLKNNPPQANWKSSEKLAYWINAYNAFTVKLILQHYPLKSIQDIDKPWDTKFITIGGSSYSLNDIEHEILRKKFVEPRIHFAVNCASMSCPPLLNKAYTAEKVYSQLDQQARSFINSSTYNTLNASNPSISKIFDWYGDDFRKKGSLIDYLNKYAKVTISGDASISYRDYDWSLNN